LTLPVGTDRSRRLVVCEFPRILLAFWPQG
jgi:hypothetical protein